MALTHQRIAFAGLALLFLVIGMLKRRPIASMLRRMAAEPGDPLDLAIFRLVIFGSLLLMPPDFERFTRLPSSLIVALPGWSSFVSWIPLDPGVFNGARTIFLVAATLAFLGLVTRPAAAVAVLSGLYVYGIPQFFGKVIQYHHLLWFAALLAASPSGDALSLGRWLDRKRRGTRIAASVAHARPLRIAWVLLGCIYFFPGVWKLWRAGIEWASAENVRNLLWFVWAERPEFQPFFRIDQAPPLLLIGGVATLIFELGFGFLLFSQRTRLLAGAAAVSFHVGNGLITGILLWPLLVCHVVFVPWAKLLAWLGVRARRVLGSGRDRTSSSSEADSNRAVSQTTASPIPATVLGIILVLGAVGTGATHVYSWPLSCYPTFARRFAATRLNFALFIKTENASEWEGVDLESLAGELDSARWFTLLRRTQDLEERERAEVLKGLFEASVQQDPRLAEAVQVRFDRLIETLEPEHRGEVLRRSLLFEWSRRP